MRKVIASILISIVISTFIITMTHASLVVSGNENNYVTKADIDAYNKEFYDMLKESDKHLQRKVEEYMKIYKISPSEVNRK